MAPRRSVVAVAVACVVASVLAVVGVDGASAAAKARSSSIDYSTAALADEITDLPGISADVIPFRQFSGYLNVDAVRGKNMFYWFIESESAPATDPVVLWTNGGPGCSGLLGLLQENGPFQPSADLTLELTEHRWNAVANMLYIETPVGVGYSYSETKADYMTGDDQTAVDNYNLILAFLARYPHLATTNEFYIASESYGGHYMPQLALQIIKGNNAGVNQAINFKGLLVGNPYIDPISNAIYGEFPTYWGHQLVSETLWEGFQSTCIAEGWEGSHQAACYGAMQAIYDNMGDLDPYALDFPLCAGATTFTSESKRIRDQSMKRHGLTHKWGWEYEMCSMDYITEYLDQADVMAALHVNASLSFTWLSCSEILEYSAEDSDAYVETAYLELLEIMPDIKLTILSGDDDSVCATVGTQHILYSLGLDVVRPWTPWYLAGQVGGYAVWFEGISFITVHTAGHMIPATQPARAFYLFSNYLAGTLPGYNETTSSSSSSVSTSTSSSHRHQSSQHRHHARVNAEVAASAAVAGGDASSTPAVFSSSRTRSSSWTPSRLHRATSELPYSVPRASAAQKHAAHKRIQAGRRQMAKLRHNREAAAAAAAPSSSRRHHTRALEPA